LIAAGHRPEDLKDGYSIAQVQLFAQALAWNRERDNLDRAEAIRLGIAQAFNPQEDLLNRLRRHLEQPGSEQAESSPGLKPEVEAMLFGVPEGEA